MATAEPQLSIIIPVHDEAGNIGPLLSEIASVLSGRLNYEVICVDDGSQDASCDEIAEALRPLPLAKLIRHRRRAGKSAAIWTGMRQAGAPWAATLDGDGQNDPADLLKIWERVLPELDAGTSLVAGRRLRRNDGLIKPWGSRLANAVRRRLLADDTRDTACGLKVFRREAFLALPYFDNMHRFYPALIKRAGAGVREVEVNDRPRVAGRSKYGVFDRLSQSLFDLVGVYWLIRRASFPEVEQA